MTTTMNRAEAIVNLDAIEANIKKIISSSGKPLLAVVKADAYGHGLIPVAKRALQAGASWLGTALLEEAIALRQSGIQAPILAWLTPIHDDFENALRSKIDIAVPSIEHLSIMVAAAERTGDIPRIHLEVDTGMSRGGALGEWRALLHATADLVKLNRIKVVGIWSHFARADEPGHTFNSEQVAHFERRVEEARGFGINPGILHLSNSAAALTFSPGHYDLLRIGIAMYGLSPDVKQLGDSEILNLHPAMTLRARIHLIKDVPSGTPVGYGGTAVTEGDTKLAVIPMGYADGIPRNSNPLAGVLIGNKRAPIIGRVSMDQFVVDLGRDSQARQGEWAYLIGNETVMKMGTNSSDGYTADSWAQASGTINYEIVTRLGPRVPRIYI
jgi:alanine racemase